MFSYDEKQRYRTKDINVGNEVKETLLLLSNVLSTWVKISIVLVSCVLEM